MQTLAGGMMVWWHALLWGVFGSFAVEALDFQTFARSTRRRRQLTLGVIDRAYLSISVVFRIALGGGVALAAFQSGQLVGPLAAVGMGAAAPLMLAQLSKVVPVPLEAPGDEAEPPVLATTQSPVAK